MQRSRIEHFVSVWETLYLTNLWAMIFLNSFFTYGKFKSMGDIFGGESCFVYLPLTHLKISSALLKHQFIVISYTIYTINRYVYTITTAMHTVH